VALLGRLRESHRIVICGQIKQEVLQGSRDSKAFAKLEQEFPIWDCEAEQPDDFVGAARLYASLRWKGETVPAADCLIAAVAKRRGWSVSATDPHFKEIPGITLVT
jgi:predicted nucleic acid-binding protein